ncbi:hypothetical protein DIPPA_06398, partial [Diplonema papillatum]
MPHADPFHVATMSQARRHSDAGIPDPRTMGAHAGGSPNLVSTSQYMEKSIEALTLDPKETGRTQRRRGVSFREEYRSMKNSRSRARGPSMIHEPTKDIIPPQRRDAKTKITGGRTTGNASWKASGASAARGNEKGDGDDRTGDQEAATNARNQRTTSAEEKGARHPEGRPDRRPQAEEDEGDHPRLRGASKEEEGSEGKQLSETTGDHGHANALESEKRAHEPALRYPSAKRTRATRTSVKMDRINALIQEARGMAERANRDQLDAVFGILDVATTLLRRQIEANSGEPAQQRPPLQQQQQPKQQQQQPRQQQQPKQQRQQPKQQQPQQQPQQQQQQQQQTQQRRPQEQQQPQSQQQQQQQTQQRRPQEQQQPQQRPRQGYAPTWAEVTRRPPPPGKIDAADWDAPVLPSPDFEAVEAGLWVAPSAAAAEEAKGPAADAVDVAERDGKRVRLGVLCREAFDDARRGPVLLEGGRVQDMYLWAGGGPVCQRGQVKVQKMPVSAVKPNAATTVLAFVVARKHASPETWECVERDPRTALTRLCRRAVKTALKTEVRVPDDAMWGVSSQQGRRELVVRVPRAQAEAILASSGRDGGFWRSTEKACRDAMPVVALQKGVTRAVALAVAERAGAAAAGLVLTGSRLLVRARSGAVLEEVRAAAAEHAAAPLESKPRFLVVGATPREHEADVEYVLREAGWQVDVATSFLRSGARVCVVTSAADPPFRVLQREGAPDLRVNPYDGGELPRERRRRLAAAPSGKRRMRLPAAEVDELPQPAAPPADAAGQKKRKTPEPAADGPEPAGDDVPMDGAEAGGHVHAFGSPAKATAGFSCALCGKKKAKGQIRTTCEGCNVGACKAMERICSYLAQRRGPEAVPHEVSRCWQNSRRLAQACMKGGQGTEGFPDHEEAKQLLTALREETSRLGREGSAARFTKYRDKLNERADASRRCLTTICAGRAEPSGVLRTGAGVTANVDEMDEALNTAWDPILRKYKDGPEPEYEPFRDRFQDHIGPHLMEAGTITGEELRILLRKKPKKSASGVDGWRMAELRELPLPLLNALADVMNLVEATGDWPASMTTALVSMVPKDESQDPLHTRPITVTSAVYRLWACRRLADIVLWQEGWIEEGQKGFRPGHRIEDVLMEIGLEVEDALLDGEPLYGVALDFRKCFDMVPREVVLRLAEDLGLHGRVLKPLRAIYSLLARRFKLPLGVGREFSVTNGILQGCPVSVILINALLSVVMKAVKKEAEGVSPKSYADDATLLSRLSEAALQKGVDIVDEFCTLTGMQLNLEKTIAFSTRQRHQSTLRLRSGNALLRFSKSVTCLGALVSTAKNRKERSDSKRVERAAALAEGLRHAPFRYEKRVRIVQSNVLPAALSGCSFAPVSKVAMKRLTTSVMGLIWGGANPKRAREMVLNFQEKGHLTDPGTCLAYRVTTAFYAACERLPRLLPLMESIRGRYAEGDQPLGPVGLAMRSMEECGHIWEPGPLSRTLRRNGAVFDPLASSPSKRGHEVRADLRTRTWARLMARRPGYQGLERADLERTNAFWKTRECSAHTAKLIRVAIAGGVNTAEFTSRMRQAGAEPQAPSCKHCGSGVTENEQHIYWDCDAYSHIRRREAHAGLMAANRTEWPRCTLEH